MRITIMCMTLLFIAGNIFAQKTQIEFIPAEGNLYPYLNSFSESDGFKQFYFENSKWVRNQAIPDFTDKNRFKELGLQYIAGDSINSPQLYAYSMKTGDFAFYYLSSDKWVLNENMPSGKIGISSNGIRSKYTPYISGKSSYIFSYSTESEVVEFLGVSSEGWSKIDNISNVLP